MAWHWGLAVGFTDCGGLQCQWAGSGSHSGARSASGLAVGLIVGLAVGVFCGVTYDTPHGKHVLCCKKRDHELESPVMGRYG